MKKVLIFCCIWIALLGVKVYAQRQFKKPLKTTSHSILGFSNYNVGLKGGCPWSYLEKTELKETTYDGHYGYLAGLFIERNLGRWSIALESTFAQKGTKMHNEKPYQISLDQPKGILKTQYEVSYHMVGVRIPITYYFKGIVKDDKVVPYLFVGPEVGIPIDREVYSKTKKFDGLAGDQPVLLSPGSQDPYTLETAFSPGFNISAVAGIGLMTKVRVENSAIIFKIDAAYNRGILNLAVPLKDGWRWPFENQTNCIFAHDVEVSFSVVYPIKKILHDACHYLQ